MLPKGTVMDKSLAEELRAAGRKVIIFVTSPSAHISQVSLNDVELICDLQLRESVALVVSSIDERSPLLLAFPIVDSTTPQVTIDLSQCIWNSRPSTNISYSFCRCLRQARRLFENISQSHSLWRP